MKAKYHKYTLLLLIAVLLTTCERVDWEKELSSAKNTTTETSTPDDTTEIDLPEQGLEKGSLSLPYSIHEIQTIDTIEGQEAWVKGYIVGHTTHSMRNVKFSTDNAVQSNIVMADDAEQRDYTYCIPAELKSTTIRKALSLLHNPNHLGEYVIIYGVIKRYYNVMGVREVSQYRWSERE